MVLIDCSWKSLFVIEIKFLDEFLFKITRTFVSYYMYIHTFLCFLYMFEGWNFHAIIRDLFTADRKRRRTKGIAGSGKAFLSRTKRFQWWLPLWLRLCITVVLVTVLLEIEVYCSTLFFCCFTAIHLRFRRSNDNFDRNSINLCALFFSQKDTDTHRSYSNYLFNFSRDNFNRVSIKFYRSFISDNCKEIIC